MKIKNKGQVWTTDFIIGLFLFIVMLLLVTKMLMAIYPSTGNQVEVYRDAIYLSDSLLSTGYPMNWTDGNVIIPGIAENNRINMTKLSEFKNMNYERTKTLLHITSDYVFFIKNSTSIMNTSQCLYGYNLKTDENCTPILTTEKYDTLVKVDRLIIYNSTVVTMVVYAWE